MKLFIDIRETFNHRFLLFAFVFAFGCGVGLGEGIGEGIAVLASVSCAVSPVVSGGSGGPFTPQLQHANPITPTNNKWRNLKVSMEALY
jgi:hypothetical protein